MNQINLIGRLVRDPELRTTNAGKSVANVTIAVRKRLKPQDPNAPDADFFRINTWGPTAEYLSNYGLKGRMMYVSGRIESRKYETDEGVEREVWEVTADQIGFLDRPTDDQGGGSGQKNQQAASRPNTRQPATSAHDEYDPFADE